MGDRSKSPLPIKLILSQKQKRRIPRNLMHAKFSARIMLHGHGQGPRAARKVRTIPELCQRRQIPFQVAGAVRIALDRAMARQVDPTAADVASCFVRQARATTIRASAQPLRPPL